MVENGEFSSSAKFANLVTYSDRQCDILSINPPVLGVVKSLIE